MAAKEKRVSKKYAKKHFSTVGLLLIMYTLFVLIIPFFLHYYLVEVDSDILKDKLMYYGIYFIIIVFGTLFPFFVMRKIFRVSFRKIYRNISATFTDLFVQTIVFFTTCIGLTYISNLLFSYLGMEGKLISSIGFSYDETRLSYPLYVFMLVAVTPIIEEYAFRGVLLNTLSKFGKKFGMYASAIIFALAHQNFAEMIPALAMGIQLGKTSLRYKSIQPTIFIHILFNCLIYALVYAMPASITRYMAYVLAAIIIIAAYLIASGQYKMIVIQKSGSMKLTNFLFFTRPTIVITMILMIVASLLFVFFE